MKRISGFFNISLLIVILLIFSNAVGFIVQETDADVENFQNNTEMINQKNYSHIIQKNNLVQNSDWENLRDTFDSYDKDKIFEYTVDYIDVPILFNSKDNTIIEIRDYYLKNEFLERAKIYHKYLVQNRIDSDYQLIFLPLFLEKDGVQAYTFYQYLLGYAPLEQDVLYQYGDKTPGTPEQMIDYVIDHQLDDSDIKEWERYWQYRMSPEYFRIMTDIFYVISEKKISINYGITNVMDKYHPRVEIIEQNNNSITVQPKINYEQVSKDDVLEMRTEVSEKKQYDVKIFYDDVVVEEFTTTLHDTALLFHSSNSENFAHLKVNLKLSDGIKSTFFNPVFAQNSTTSFDVDFSMYSLENESMCIVPEIETKCKIIIYEPIPDPRIDGISKQLEYIAKKDTTLETIFISGFVGLGVSIFAGLIVYNITKNKKKNLKN